ncbi:MAG: UvrABC system protein A [Candidatus Woesebacteria bacterium GW2011_GWB1_38_8]|uniref:UvrABC system protein A n=1 Tax=Candidatus Woesebacteria bacterium GW2011_GWB1_38_8 TaxID=1618570 RepID=A0A0G0L2Q6_9BACT|nr:MAG: UvrABC system protein A [Candidatus Woesebacteria bacterium GW2011_GWB1_38_8]
MDNSIKKELNPLGYIRIKGAKQHNLKNIDLDIPKNNLVCFTGVSGSGKSSLAFDTIYAEGQRRYVESLSTYARQFLGLMEKPDVDFIEGLSPSISIDQKTTSRNPRSTVGTITEIYDYLRLLFARIGHPHCPICGREISSQSLDEIVDAIYSLICQKLDSQKKARFIIFSPIVVDKKGEFSQLLDNLKAKGIRYVRVDGKMLDLSEEILLIKTNKHSIDAQIDRISLTADQIKDNISKTNLRSRLSESLERALELSNGLVIISEVLDKALSMPEIPLHFKNHLYSERFACPVDNIQIPEIEPRTFSFNSPQGACPSCNGIGRILKVEPDLMFSEEISITEGGILPLGNIFENDTWYARLILTVCKLNAIDTKCPINNLTDKQKQTLLLGTGTNEYKVEGTNRFGKWTYIYESFPGIISDLENRHSNTESDWVRLEIEKYMREKLCPECKGARLKKEALAITIKGLSISEVTALSINEALTWINILNAKDPSLTYKEKEISKLILKEINARLVFLASVGLEYLNLDRNSGTLSGGESQRIRLASQIGSGLTGVLYVLDEPTIGLHQKDNERLLNTLKKLRDLGNTVIIVEHDAQTINNSDYVFDFGPGAGKFGGEVVAKGTPEEICKNSKSITGQYLSGRRQIEVGSMKLENGYRLKKSQFLNQTPDFKNQNSSITLYGCTQYNLKNIDVVFPLNKFICITGVSGSGKSTLLVDTLYTALENNLNNKYRGEVGKYKDIHGLENIDKVILIDQSAIGRTPRSNPATYTKVFDPIRDVFAQTRSARVNGFKKGRFSFNVKGGRCEACEGQGQIKIEMQFMSDIWVTCEVCGGKRYNNQTLDIDFRGKNISDVLALTIEEAIEYFHSIPSVLAKLETLISVGLGYMELGQAATTLSGGEAQRVKLATELSKKETGSTMYILDEPTTGLHFADVEKLLRVLKLLVSKGNTVVVIEHNIDVIKKADWIIDLGPEGGDLGGYIVAQGSVNDLKNSDKSYTAQFL